MADSELLQGSKLYRYLDNISKFNGSVENFVKENGLYLY